VGAVLGPFGVNFLIATPSASPDAEFQVYHFQVVATRVARMK